MVYLAFREMSLKDPVHTSPIIMNSLRNAWPLLVRHWLDDLLFFKVFIVFYRSFMTEILLIIVDLFFSIHVAISELQVFKGSGFCF